MSARTSRKRTTTQRFGIDETIVKDEPKLRDDDETPASRRQRQRQRPAQGGGTLLTQTPQAQAQRGRDEERPNPNTKPNPYMAAAAPSVDCMKISDISLNKRQLDKWEKVSNTEKAQIIKAVARLLLLKGM
jgi:hypothetical protein